MQYPADNLTFPLFPRLDKLYNACFDHMLTQCILLVLSSSQRTRPKVWKGSAPSQGLYLQPVLQHTSFNCSLLKSVDDGFDMRWYSHTDCWHGILRQASRGTNNTEAKGLKSTLFPRCGLPGWPWPPRLTDVLFSSCRHVFNYICIHNQPTGTLRNELQRCNMGTSPCAFIQTAGRLQFPTDPPQDVKQVFSPSQRLCMLSSLQKAQLVWDRALQWSENFFSKNWLDFTAFKKLHQTFRRTMLSTKLRHKFVKVSACDDLSDISMWVAVKTSVNSWDHPTFETSLRFSTFGVLGIMGYRSGILRLEFLAFLSTVRIEKKWKKKGIAFEISHRFTGFWHLMTGDIMNQTSEVLTDAHVNNGLVAILWQTLQFHPCHDSSQDTAIVNLMREPNVFSK